MTRKLNIEIYDEEIEEPKPFLKLVTEIVNATPAEYLESLVIETRTHYESEMARVKISYERQQTAEEFAAEEAERNAKADAYRNREIEHEKHTLRILRARYPND